jgi:hypothetical protein
MVALVLAGCSANRDSGFSLWCGGTLCHWQLERGEIERVPTWHRSDYGVAFVGDDVAISQVVPGGIGDCWSLESVANIAEDAKIVVDFDFANDGTVDRSERIPSTSNWNPVRFRVEEPPGIDDLRIVINKAGFGKAELGTLSLFSGLEYACMGL